MEYLIILIKSNTHEIIEGKTMITIFSQSIYPPSITFYFGKSFNSKSFIFY
jgi:hypothetical protein